MNFPWREVFEGVVGIAIAIIGYFVGRKKT
jgi:hypothetical protein